MGYRHTKDEIREGALAAAIADGLSQLTFGRVAKRLGISDRIVVYYFPTKDDLIGEVLAVLGARLQATLATAFTAPAASHLALAAAAWPVLARPEADPAFALYFEAIGLAAAGREPYRSLAPQMIEGWTAWLATFFDGSPTVRRTEAHATLALIDGLLLLRQLVGPAAASRAAAAIGVLRR